MDGQATGSEEAIGKMKAGILTFHWATNYGAVLQAYALQQTLTRLGMDVEVINYKPRRYDDSLHRFFKEHKYEHLSEYRLHRKKERSIGKFRRKNLNLTRRVHTCAEIGKLARRYDVIISGSDQVMNPSFLMWGESSKRRSPSYFLGFPYEGRRVAYAVSFGCVEYPREERELAAHYIGAFESIGVRENTGVAIVESMGRSDAVVVPDPTILLPSEYYDSLATEGGRRDRRREEKSGNYTYCFFLRNEEERRVELGAMLAEKELWWNQDDGDYSMQGWLCKIREAECVLTDSFHCMVMCLKLHKPFVVVTDVEGNEGMNDRFYSLLGRLGLAERVVHKGKLSHLDALEREGNEGTPAHLGASEREVNKGKPAHLGVAECVVNEETPANFDVSEHVVNDGTPASLGVAECVVSDGTLARSAGAEDEGGRLVERLLREPIDWPAIDHRLNTFATTGEEFLGRLVRRRM